MRLTCPSCGAAYEIADDLVPPGGRDVQCSNCGTTWFQEPEARRAPTRTMAAADAPARAPIETQDAAEAPEPDAPPSARRRPEPSVMDVLRQEREHEARARAAERADTPAENGTQIVDTAAASPEPSDDPADTEPARTRTSRPLDAVPPADRGARERARMAAAAALARSRNRTPPSEPEAPETAEPAESTEDAISRALMDASQNGDAPAPGAEATANGRRALLPDIEEINSTLRPDERAAAQAEGEAADGAAAPKKRGGFRTGFLTVLSLVVVALLLYVFAAPLAEAVPPLAEPLGAYVTWVDGLRAWLDGAAGALADRLAQAG